MSQSVGVGIDFGTTNSAAAIYDGEQVRLVRLETNDVIMPSATYIDRALQTRHRTGRDRAVHSRQHRAHRRDGAGGHRREQLLRRAR